VGQRSFFALPAGILHDACRSHQHLFLQCLGMESLATRHHHRLGLFCKRCVLHARSGQFDKERHENEKQSHHALFWWIDRFGYRRRAFLQRVFCLIFSDRLKASFQRGPFFCKMHSCRSTKEASFPKTFSPPTSLILELKPTRLLLLKPVNTSRSRSVTTLKHPVSVPIL